jgi:hypothetical protein
MIYIKCIISSDNEIEATKIAEIEKCKDGGWLYLPTNNKLYRELKIDRIINKEYKLKKQVKLIGVFTDEEIDKIKHYNNMEAK